MATRKNTKKEVVATKCGYHTDYAVVPIKNEEKATKETQRRLLNIERDSNSKIIIDVCRSIATFTATFLYGSSYYFPYLNIEKSPTCFICLLITFYLDE